ncbi:hypothetical protein [Arthrobacter mobilis]|uniref:Uncharacterized protein n=1 Tax=Arthrobacter mobilis TaxID=2724944 RepID=A0A7X6HFL2_9MICC|nr:hypothetical protein [Arthrobacter mobilis]NKX55131.1 hypothetical protein [Arthrobacter mobilis]
MPSLFDVLAGPGRVLPADYAGDPAGRREYHAAVARVYRLLIRLHDEILDQLTEAQLAADRDDAVQLLAPLLDPEFLQRDFRARELCGELQKQSLALLDSGLIEPGSEAAGLVQALAGREQGTAEVYVRELRPGVEDALSAVTFAQMQEALTQFRNKLVSQQAAFMGLAEEALRRARM